MQFCFVPHSFPMGPHPPHTFLFPPKSNLLVLNFSVKSDVAALFLTTSLKTSFFQLNERTSSSQAVYPTMQSQSLPLSVCPSVCVCCRRSTLAYDLLRNNNNRIHLMFVGGGFFSVFQLFMFLEKVFSFGVFVVTFIFSTITSLSQKSSSSPELPECIDQDSRVALRWVKEKKRVNTHLYIQWLTAYSNCCSYVPKK